MYSELSTAWPRLSQLRVAQLDPSYRARFSLQRPRFSPKARQFPLAISFVGFLLSFGIRGDNLEAEGWSDEDEDEDEEEDIGDEGPSANERTGLIRK
jgi:hypothetical protein